LLQLLERDAFSAADKPPLRQMVVFQVLDMTQDRLARVKAFGAAGLSGQRVQALLDLGRQAKGKHASDSVAVLYIYSTISLQRTSIGGGEILGKGAPFPPPARSL
jgi:hypothetical protein